MTNTSTKEVLAQYYDGVKQKNGWQSVIADDMVCTLPGKTSNSKTAYVEITERFLRAVTDSNVKESIIDENKACVVVAYDMRSPKGNTSTKDVVEIISVKDGKIASSSIYFDTEDFKAFMAQ